MLLCLADYMIVEIFIKEIGVRQIIGISNNFTGFLYRNSKEKVKALEDDFPLEDTIRFKNYDFQ